ncbi:MAG: N-6 DNA methylase, partial [Dehalococcoidia bacterium]|nr:N-6 DNA methylase [Dehalococcoidia bacterium]
THRSALEALIGNLSSGVTATNEPKHIECGAPDFIIRKGALTIGYIEAKDIGKSLDETEKTEQLKRYFPSLSNLILTDYLEFRWYVDGESRLSARLGTLTADSKIKRDNTGIQAVAELLSVFLAHKAEAVGTPKELAMRMARQAHLIRNLIINAFGKETEGGNLHSQLVAFRDNLIPDLSVEQFADMYAQTLAYGLFAARCTSDSGKDFTRQNAAYLLPKTNPFLRKLFNQIAGPDLDDRIAWLVDELAQVLAQADMEAVLKDFGKRTAKEDPVVHFYETFLKEYDPKVREMRGVYYTPEPVVSYIVRSIDHLLKTRFNKSKGLADENTLILDPAVGTATFLYMVINEIYQAIAGKGQQGLWNNYVADKLLPRIFGFELLMAPYAVAHLKLGLLLQETGYKFKTDQRLGIYLTNTLEEAIKHSETLFAQWITEEANAAARVKKDEPIMVVLGNPPYSVSSLNRGEWIDTLIDDYKQGLNEKKLNIDDDYIKFIRFAQWRIDSTDFGILGFITNNSYLDGLTHRRMREYLLESFSSIYILNLHGSSRRGEQAPSNIKDENVFDIQQGVAIGIFVREPEKTGDRHVYYADIWGTRESKYKKLFDLDVASINWRELKPTAPYFFFVPKDFTLKNEYDRAYSICDVFPLHHNGIGTDRDELFYDYSATVLESRMRSVFESDYNDEFRERYRIWSSSSFELEKRLKAAKFDTNNIKDCLYRPFDIRKLYYDAALTSRPAFPVMRHMLQNNIALCITRQLSADQFRHVFIANCLVDRDPLSLTTRERAHIFPLYVYPAEGEMQLGNGQRRPNLNPEFIKAVSEKLGLEFVEDGWGDFAQTFGPDDIFNYAYAIFHSPTYRTRYAEFLKINFPRLPLTSDKQLFKALAAKGAELVSLHLMDSPMLNNLITRYPVAGSNTVEKVSYDDNNRRVYINKVQYFEGVPPEVWNFHIGGYQVCQKWLKDRKGRTLTYDDLTHYQKVVVALKETIRLMSEIDKLIPGWPVE